MDHSRLIEELKLARQKLLPPGKELIDSIDMNLNLELLISAISANIIAAKSDSFEPEIIKALKWLVEFFDLDRSTLFAFSDDMSKLSAKYSYASKEFTPVASEIVSDMIPHHIGLLKKGEFVWFGSLDDLPEAFNDDLGFLKKYQLEAGYIIPIFYDHKIKYALAGGLVDRKKDEWAVELFPRIQFIGEILAAAIERMETETKLRNAYSTIQNLKDELDAENTYLKEEIKSLHGFKNIIGNSLPLNYVLQRVKSVAPTSSSVLIEGETGTGKELIAHAIHSESLLNQKSMIKVSCAALSSNLIESELFGHEKGAFTGANTRRIGRFELANGSTLFLDEIGELPLELQAKLLRVLQEGEFERLGSSKTVKTDARIIAATNRKLEEEVKKGHFREDLYYRLSRFVITIPPLRERKGDIHLLVNSIVDQCSKNIGKKVRNISSTTMNKLESYHWPGNVRELQNVIEQAVILANRGVLKIELPRLNKTQQKDDPTLEDMERDHIQKILEKTNWRIAGMGGAAEILGLKRTTLQSRIKKLGIKMKK